MTEIKKTTKDELVREILFLRNQLNTAQSQAAAHSPNSSEKLARVILDEMYQFAALLEFGQCS